MSSSGKGGGGCGPRACCSRSTAPPSVGDEGCATPTSQLLVSLPPQTPSARELELEDRQSRLQQELRERMAVEGRRRGAGMGAVGAGPLPPPCRGLTCVVLLRPPEDGGGLGNSVPLPLFLLHTIL